MSTEVTLFGGAQAGLPAYLADINATGNIEPRANIPTLSFRGKVFRIGLEGTEMVVKNAEGDPATSVEIIILDYNKARSRAMYPAYVEGQSKPPICWSNDGVTPDHDVQTKQAAACATCPQAAKGSKIGPDGKPGVACAQFKRAVVVPSVKPGFEKLLLKIPQTSMYDKDNKENEAAGFYAFDQYMDMLHHRGVKHTASVLTKVKFDMRQSYPKLLFAAANWVPPEKYAVVQEQLNDKARIEELLKTVDVSTAAAEAPVPEAFEQPAVAAAAPVAAPAPAPAPAAPAATKPAGRPAGKSAAQKAAEKALADAQALVAAAAAQPAPADDGGGITFDDAAPAAQTFIPAAQPAPAVAAATPVAPAAAAPAAAAPAAKDALAGLMDSWAQS